MDEQDTQPSKLLAALLVSGFAVFPQPADADLYRCTEGGRTVISNMPCDRQSPPVRHGAEAAPAAQALQAPTRGNIIAGYVVGIADGDTITVLDANRQQHKIRLAGIDAPEMKQAFGNRSRQNLAAMVFNKTVDVEWDKHDKYGRTVGKVMVNGVDANLEQIKTGMAWWYEKYRREQSPEDQRRYAEAEQQARAARVGLWRDPVPMAPWDWRSDRRSR